MKKFSEVTINSLLKYLPNGNNGNIQNRIKKAFEFAQISHGDFRRESGEQYIDHDLAVAHIMLQLDVDANTLIACLLHDILLPHTGIEPDDIIKKFGPEVFTLVNGLYKLQNFEKQKLNLEKQSSVESGSVQPDQKIDKKSKKQQKRKLSSIEIFRQAILTIIEGDIRIILIRMADCLQDLRKASYLEREKQLEIAKEAMQIYAPLASRLGVWHMKWELEDMAFRYLDPENYKKIASQLSERRTKRSERIEEAAKKLRNRVSEEGLNAEVSGRPKHIYSIYRKLQRKNLTFDELYDIQALRVILQPADPEAYEKKSSKEKDDEDRRLCYLALGAVHSLWQPIMHEFDDYIANPKPNGYKSLHTAVFDKATSQHLEVQIRTQRMHDEAEKGVAAHWSYKEEGVQFSTSVQRRIQSLRELLTTLQDTDSIEESDDLFDSEILAERIYVFTPNGDVIELPLGATPIDFAYQIHTSIGHRCRGARVNGKMVSLDYRLRAGERVEIITSNRGGPNRDWMNASLGYTGSARTRSKIRQWFRKQERGKNIQQGREVVERELKRLNLSDTYDVEDLVEAFKYDDEKEFLAKVGFGDIQSTQLSGAIALMQQKSGKKVDEELQPLLLSNRLKTKGITVLGTSGLPVKMAKCCNPIPPEKIVGYITRGHGITIHRTDCKQVAAITDHERLIDEVDWGLETETFPIPIVVKAFKRPNLIDEMTNILRGQQISAPQTKTTTTGSILTVFLVVQVTSLEQLNYLLKKFENLKNVIEARRKSWS